MYVTIEQNVIVYFILLSAVFVLLFSYILM